MEEDCRDIEPVVVAASTLEAAENWAVDSLIAEGPAADSWAGNSADNSAADNHFDSWAEPSGQSPGFGRSN